MGLITDAAETSPVSENLMRELQRSLHGALLRSGDAEYDEACTIWNGAISRRPSIVARVSDSADIATCVNVAREGGLQLSIRGGGHNITGAALGDGGLMIDMSRRRVVGVDPRRAIVHAEAGATWGDVDRASQSFGLVVPGGIVSHTGVAGLTLGGGFGWTSRKFGFAADNLISVEIVTADGKLRRASATENPDLFWALRGGGGNFGSVTSFEFAAHPHGPLAMCGIAVYPFMKARHVVRRFREVSENASDALCCLLMLRRAPAVSFLPADLHGEPIAALAACWTGDPGEGEEAVRPLRTVGTPVADTFALKPFTIHQTMFDAAQPFGRRYYWKSHYCGEVSDGLAEVICAGAERIPSPHSSILLMQSGGAAARCDPLVNAVGARAAPYVLNIQGAWESPLEDSLHRDWARQCWAGTEPFAMASAYVNFMTEDEGSARVRAAYGEQIYARLRDIKSKFDPSNLFRGAQNIEPRGVP